MTKIEENIYNTYLRILRTSQDKPFTYRKNFKDFEENKNYPYIKRISNMLVSSPHISLEDYLIAPYKVYGREDDSVYTLEFYASRKALGCYRRYMALRELEDPDEEHQLRFIKDSLQFILKFCMDNKLTFEEYLMYKRGFTYEWMKHYAEKKVSLHCFFETDNTFDIIMGVEEEHRQLLVGDLENKFYSIKGKYLKSTKAKKIVNRGLELIRRYTENTKKEK